MNTLTQPTHVREGARFQEHAAFPLVILVALILLALAACTRGSVAVQTGQDLVHDSRGVPASSRAPAAGSPITAVTRFEDLPIYGYIQAHQARGGYVVPAYVETTSPECGALAYCGYLQMHTRQGEQAAAKTAPVAVAQVECGSLPICGYIQMHHTGSTAVRATSGPTARPQCDILTYCGYLVAHGIESRVVGQLVYLPPEGESPS